MVVAPKKEDMYLRTSILGHGVKEKLSLAVIYFVDGDQKPIGTGYFVAPKVAISAAHTFKKDGKKMVKIGTTRTGYFGKPHHGKTCQVVVALIDWENDFVVFVLREGAEKAAANLEPAYLEPAPVRLDAGDECILVAYQIGIHEELPELGKEPSVGVFPGAITKAHDRHFVYSAPSFAGDSGGAIILRGGQAVGMHIMTVNQAIELRKLKELEQETATTSDIVQHVNSVEESVGSLIASLNSGSLGISISSVMEAYESNQDSKRKALKAVPGIASNKKSSRD
jgi:Trypsin